MKNNETDNGIYNIPIWEKYVLSIDEAAAYFHIGQNKLYDLAKRNEGANWILQNGNRILIKRALFEQYVDKLQYI